MNGFRKLQERLTQEGWYVGWNHYCCQTCGWNEVPYEADFDKVLFNHSQDCELDIYEDHYKCEECDGEGYVDDAGCLACDEYGYIVPPEDKAGLIEEDGFICFPPEMQFSSLFCFSGSDKGTQNLIEILPIIEECGCKWYWDKTGSSRIEISWEAA